MPKITNLFKSNRISLFWPTDVNIRENNEVIQSSHFCSSERAEKKFTASRSIFSFRLISCQLEMSDGHKCIVKIVKRANRANVNVPHGMEWNEVELCSFLFSFKNKKKTLSHKIDFKMDQTKKC